MDTKEKEKIALFFVAGLVIGYLLKHCDKCNCQDVLHEELGDITIKGYGTFGSKVINIEGVPDFVFDRSTAPVADLTSPPDMIMQKGKHGMLNNGTITITAPGTLYGDIVSVYINGQIIDALDEVSIYGNANNIYQLKNVSFAATDKVVIYFGSNI